MRWIFLLVRVFVGLFAVILTVVVCRWSAISRWETDSAGLELGARD